MCKIKWAVNQDSEGLVQVSRVIWDPYTISSNYAASSINRENIYTGYLGQAE